MKPLIVLCSFLVLKTCNQSKNEQKIKNTNSIEYRETVDINSEEENIFSIHNDEIKKANPVNNKEIHTIQDTALNNIQQKIIEASYKGFLEKNTEKLDEIERFLKSSEVSNKKLKDYWIAFIDYYKTIIYIQLKDTELGSISNKKGIDILENNKKKNSDDYALLVLLKGISFNFASSMEAPYISKDINKLLEKGIEVDDKNFRLFYAQGSVDFYTPKEYGGGKKTESSLLKAIDLPEKNNFNSQLPTWGKEESYDLIIRFYLRENQKKKANIYFDKAKLIFPDSYVIQMHQSNFNS